MYFKKNLVINCDFCREAWFPDFQWFLLWFPLISGQAYEISKGVIPLKCVCMVTAIVHIEVVYINSYLATQYCMEEQQWPIIIITLPSVAHHQQTIISYIVITYIHYYKERVTPVYNLCSSLIPSQVRDGTIIYAVCYNTLLL